MADYQRVVEYLRDLRLNPPPPLTDELRQYAAEYADLCYQANERLRQCSSFLQKGLRSEAIHLADESPNLLDLVAALDLPEAGLWAEFCQTNGLPAPPQLQMERAAQLNDAYAADQPLEHLMAQHRLLALSRAPVKDRLGIMRALATADPALAANAFWEKDLRVFERARIRELPSLFYGAVRERDFVRIADLAKEIEQSPWLEPLPADLREAVADAYTRMSRAQVEERLRDLVPKLREAFAARSQADCASLLKQWRDTMKSAGVESVSRDLLGEIEPINAWLLQENELQARQKSFAAACEQFAMALDVRAPLSELEPARAKLQSHEMPIPAELDQRYQARLQDQASSVRRRFMITLGFIGAGVAAIILVVGVAVFIYLRTSSAASWADRIESANSAHSVQGLHRAQDLIKELNTKAPQFKDDHRVVEAVNHTKLLQDEYDRDVSTITSLVAQINEAITAATPVSTAPAAPIDDLLTQATRLDEALKPPAHDLTWADTDNRLASATTTGSDLRAALRAQAAKQVRTQLDGLKEQFAAVPANPAPAELSGALGQVTAITTKAAALRDLQGLDESTKADVAKFIARLEQRREEMEGAKGLIGDMQNVAQKATSADDLKKALEDFVAKFPKETAASDFSKAIEALPVARGVEAWKGVLSGWGIGATPGARFAPSGADEANTRIDKINAFVTAHPAAPMVPTARTYAAYLKAGSEGLAKNNTWSAAFTDITSHPLYTELAYMQDSAGKRYYVLGDIKRGERRINNEVTITFQALNPKDLTKRVTVTIDPPNKLTTKDPVLLPQSKFVVEMGDRMKFLSDADWDTHGFDLIDKIVSEADMDIVVKAVLLQVALNTQKAVCGWAVGDIYDKAAMELDRQPLDKLTWYDTDHPTADSTREALKKAIADIPAKKDALARYTAAKAALFKGLLFDPTGKGVLLKNDKNEWTVFTKDASGEGYKAWAVVPPAAADQPGSLKVVATYKNGKYVIDETALSALPQGTMVFTGK